MIVETATGKTVSEYAAEKFWKPMGAVNDALWCLDDEKRDGTGFLLFEFHCPRFCALELAL